MVSVINLRQTKFHGIGKLNFIKPMFIPRHLARIANFGNVAFKR